MPVLNILPNKTQTIDLADEVIDSGWEIQGGLAAHYPCNAGYIKLNIPLVIGQSYNVRFEVDDYVSGSVRVEAGTAQGINRSANGIFTQTIVCTGNTLLRFYSDGFLKVKVLKFWKSGDVEDKAVTISFYDGTVGTKKWSGDFSFKPEWMVNSVDGFFTFKNGMLYKQGASNVMNNFYGIQYESKITFIVNIDPTTVKLFYGIREISNKVWYCPDDNSIIVYPTDKKPKGMASRLKRKRFTNLQGQWFADFLKNLLDPRFATTLDALNGGEDLRGELMEITLTCDSSEPVTLFQVDIKTSASMYTY